MRSNFKPWGTYFRKMFEEIGNIALKHEKHGHNIIKEGRGALSYILQTSGYN